jgi:hypothetical protein
VRTARGELGEVALGFQADFLESAIAAVSASLIRLSVYGKLDRCDHLIPERSQTISRRTKEAERPSERERYHAPRWLCQSRVFQGPVNRLKLEY